MHTPLAQSLGCEHDCVAAQGEQTGPPQSMSVSRAFFRPSVHVGATQRCAVHTPLKQSFPVKHAFALTHGRQAPPPQSLSVSPLLVVPSVQWLGTHDPFAQAGVVGVAEQDVATFGLHCAHTSAPPLSGSGEGSHVPWPLHEAPGIGLDMRAPFTQVKGLQGLPSSGTFVSSATLVMFPLVSQTFFWQLPYTWDGAAPAVYESPQTPLLHVATASEAHGPGGAPGHDEASVHDVPPSLASTVRTSVLASVVPPESGLFAS
jgi:hypothetical protein